MVAHGAVELGLNLARLIRPVQMILAATAGMLHGGAAAHVVLLVRIHGGRLGAALILALTVEICV